MMDAKAALDDSLRPIRDLSKADPSLGPWSAIVVQHPDGTLMVRIVPRFRVEPPSDAPVGPFEGCCPAAEMHALGRGIAAWLRRLRSLGLLPHGSWPEVIHRLEGPSR